MVELCLHIANLLYLASFLGRDMLWLRVLTCGGLVLGIVFFSCQATPLYGPTAWHVTFLVINLVQIWRLVLERRRLTLTDDQVRAAEAAFRDLSRDELLTLLTRVTCKRPKSFRELGHLCRGPLSAEERALRDIAFSRLSRSELLNLLTRRLWSPLRRLNPARWRWRRRRNPASGPVAPELVPARGSETE